MNNHVIKNSVIAFILLILISLNVKAQVWVENIPENKKNNPGFLDYKDAFYSYFDAAEKKDYKAFKKFKRWEWIVEQRVDENGKIPTETIFNEWQKLKEQRELKSINGDWTSLGPNYTPLWKSFGSKSGSGRIDCIEFHPLDSNIIWAGSHSGGLWKTTDGGITWFTTTDDLISIGISDIVIHPNNHNTLYLGTGDRDGFSTNSIGILRSTDGGLSWNTTGMTHNVAQNMIINEILINPLNPNALIAATNVGIYKSYDEGSSWGMVGNGNFMDIEYKPGDTTMVYAATYSTSTGASIYRSTDGGNAFVQLTTTGIASSEVRRISLAVSPANANTVYALCCKGGANTELYGVYRTDDSGDTWYQTLSGTTKNILGRAVDGSDVQSQGWYVLSIAVSPTNINEIYTGSINIWKSTDGGYTWEILTHETPGILPDVEYTWVDHHEMKFNPQTHVLYSANDGGVYRSSDQGDTWVDLSDGLDVTQFYRIGLHESDKDVYVGGCQDQFGFLYKSGSWSGLYTGEAGDHFIDPIDPSIIYSTGYGGGVQRSTNGGYSYQNINPPGVDNFVWLPPFIMNPHNRNTLYFGLNKVYKSVNRGDDWVEISADLSQYGLRKIDVAYTDTNTIYALGYIDLWKTTDGGATWQSISAGLPNGTFNEIEVSKDNPNTLWVTYIAYTNGMKVYRSDDGGVSWTNVSDNLPNIWMNSLVYQRGTNNGIYCGTEMGVFYRDDNLTDWIDFSNGLPNVIVPEMEIHYASGKLRAGTFGRGFWESDLYSSGSYVNETIIVTPLQVYPNPSTGLFNVNIGFAADLSANIKVVNCLGKLIYNQEVGSVNGNIRSTINLENYSKGIYNVIVETENSVISKKILVL